MSDLYPRGNVYCNDPQYDLLQGRLVARNEITGITRDGWKVRHCVTVIDFGKPLRDVAEPDELIDTEERFNRIGATGQQLAVEAVREKAQARHDAAQERIVDYLQVHGATSARQIADGLNLVRSWTYEHLADRDGDVYQRIRTGGADMWGLAGVEYDAFVALPPYARLFARALRDHGPMSMRALCQLTGTARGSADMALRRYDDVFAVVGDVVENRRRAALWGLVDTGP